MFFSISLRVVRIKCASRELGLSMYTFVAQTGLKSYKKMHSFANHQKNLLIV